MADSASTTEADATADLWRHRSPRSSAIPFAAALTGVDAASLADTTAIAVASSPEAATLLDGMELRIRTLPTTVVTAAERCVGSVRGPILWSETITARANALGNDDVFVCMTTERSYDRIENQLLVDALTSIAAAAAAVDRPAGADLDSEEAEHIRTVASAAARWRADSRLAGIRPGRLTGRAAARLRGGHRRASTAPVIAVRQRTREPFAAEDLGGLCDEWTRRLHQSVLRVLEAMDRPRVLTFSDGSLWCRTLSFRHPARSGPAPAGLAVRGVPVLPADADVEGAPWADELPRDGHRLTADADPASIRALADQA